MNKTAVLLLVPMLLLAVNWEQWETGRISAKKSGKPLLVSFVRDGCHYCHDMERAVFNDLEMSHWVESCFVPVKVNLSYEKAPFEARVPMTPTFVLLKPDGKTVIKTIPGSWNIPDFKSLTASACQKD